MQLQLDGAYRGETLNLALHVANSGGCWHPQADSLLLLICDNKVEPAVDVGQQVF